MIAPKAILILEGYEIEVRARAERLAHEGALGKGQNRDELIPLKHVLSMLPKARRFFYDGEYDKGNRWLGFIQGVLWMEGIYTIDAMRRHNR
jgi:hypothetical protein